MVSDNPESNSESSDSVAEEVGGLTQEQALRKRAGRTIGRGVWLVGFEAEHPNATVLEKKEAWQKEKDTFKRIGMKALRTLEKTGMRVVEDSGSDN